MNLRQTAELAVLAAIKSADIIRRPEPVSTQSLHAYWKSSRVRLQSWFAGLRALPGPGGQMAPPSPLLISERVRVSRAILVAELLTRVWSTVLTARDAARGEDAAAAVVRNVYTGQLEARRAVLELLSDDHCIPSAEAASLDRLRRRVERWTDVLVGPLVRDYDVGEFAFDAERARDSVRSSSPLLPGESQEAINQLTFLGLSHAFPGGSDRVDDRLAAGLDRAVARAVLSAFGKTAVPPDGWSAKQPVDPRERLAAVPGETQVASLPASSIMGLRFAELRRRFGGRENNQSRPLG